MAKKKNSQFLPGLLEDIMSLLTPEEQEIAFELFNDGANQVDEELSHIYYHHQCPDYRLIAQPVASYLMPLWTMDDMSSLSPAEIYSSCAVIPQETLERDLRNFIFNIFVVYRKMPEKCYSYRMWYALGIMGIFVWNIVWILFWKCCGKIWIFMIFISVIYMKQCCLPLPINWDRIN